MDVIRQTNLLKDGGATLSACLTYRYHLWREWDNALPPLAFLMLNPSTADALQDDRTITTCKRIAALHGHGRIDVFNLFAFRSTEPRHLAIATDPVGPHNDSFLQEHLSRLRNSNGTCIAAWGAHGKLHNRAGHVQTLCAQTGIQLHALHINADGSPHHPLYLKLPPALLPYPHPAA